HARGAGTGLAGGALGRGIVVDLSRYMRHIVQTGDDFVRVEAGVVLDELNRALAPQGRYIGPDPATYQVTTIGGMVAVNASGSHFPAVGTTRRHVRSLEVVLADGEVVEVGSHDLFNAKGNIGIDRYVLGVDEICSRHADAIATGYPAT